MTTTTTRFLLPPEAYYSDEWFEREQEELFARTWNFVGPVSDMPSDGSSLLTTAGQEWDRDDTGSIHVNSVLGTNRVNTLRLSLTREDDRFAPNGFPAFYRR